MVVSDEQPRKQYVALDVPVALCPKPSGSVRDVSEEQSRKQDAKPVAFCPKPSGSVRDVSE